MGLLRSGLIALRVTCVAAECAGYGGSKRSSGTGSFFSGCRLRLSLVLTLGPLRRFACFFQKSHVLPCSHEIRGVYEVFLHVFPLQLFASIPCRLSSITKVFCYFVRLWGNLRT